MSCSGTSQGVSLGEVRQRKTREKEGRETRNASNRETEKTDDNSKQIEKNVNYSKNKNKQIIKQKSLPYLNATPKKRMTGGENRQYQ